MAKKPPLWTGDLPLAFDKDQVAEWLAAHEDALDVEAIGDELNTANEYTPQVGAATSSYPLAGWAYTYGPLLLDEVRALRTLLGRYQDQHSAKGDGQ